MKPTHIPSPTKMASLAIVYHAGPAYETAKEAGVSHLLEHVICEGYSELEDEMQAYGIEANAGTFTDLVVFHITGLDSSIRQVADRWIKAITGYKLDPKDFLQEAPIVLQEIRDRDARPDSLTRTLLNQELLGHHCALGTEKTVGDLNVEDLIQAKERLFSVPGLILYCGPEPLDLEVPYFSDDMRDQPDLEEKVALPILAELKDDPKSYQLHFATKIEGWSMADKSALSVAFSCLSDGLSSPLITLVRKQHGLSYSCWSMRDDYHSHTSVAGIQVKCSKKNVAKARSLVQGLVDDPESWLTPERFNQIMCCLSITETMHAQAPHEVFEHQLMKHIAPHYDVQLSGVTREKALEMFRRVSADFKVYDSSDIRALSLRTPKAPVAKKVAKDPIRFVKKAGKVAAKRSRRS